MTWDAPEIELVSILGALLLRILLAIVSASVAYFFPSVTMLSFLIALTEWPGCSGPRTRSFGLCSVGVLTNLRLVFGDFLQCFIIGLAESSVYSLGHLRRPLSP